VFILRNRLAALFVCIALLGAIDTADARRQLNIRYASADVTAHTDPVAATLGLDGLSARLFASSRSATRSLLVLSACA